MFDSTGVRADTFLPYADDYWHENAYGNWWWSRLDGSAGGSSGRGTIFPEMGAGSAASPADINIEARGALIMRCETSGSLCPDKPRSL